VTGGLSRRRHRCRRPAGPEAPGTSWWRPCRAGILPSTCSPGAGRRHGPRVPVGSSASTHRCSD